MDLEELANFFILDFEIEKLHSLFLIVVFLLDGQTSTLLSHNDKILSVLSRLNHAETIRFNTKP